MSNVQVAESNLGYNLTPVTAYMANENFKHDSLLEFVKSLGEKAKMPFHSTKPCWMRAKNC